MIARTFTDDALVFHHTPPGLVRGLGAITLLVNGGMVLAGVLLLLRAQLLGIALTLLGSLGAVFGLVMIFGGRMQRIDRTRITQTWSFVVPVHTRRIEVASLRSLVLARTYRRVKYSVVVIDLLLAVRADDARVQLCASGYPEFGSDVDAIVRFLGLPVRDERERDIRKMVRDTQWKALPVALALALVLICLAGVLALTIVSMQNGPSENEPVFEPLPSTESTEPGTMPGDRANHRRRRSVSGRQDRERSDE